jgi:hypothetical protein
MLALGRFVVVIAVGTGLIAALWVWLVGSPVGGLDAIAIAWQVTPFVLAAVGVALPGSQRSGLLAAAGAIAVAVGAYAIAWYSPDAFAFMFVLVAPLPSLILVTAVIGMGAAMWDA